MSSVKNFYSNLPEVPYQKTKIEMAAVVVYIRSLSVSIAVKIAIYVIFRNESANGQKGVNENYAGIQADSGSWPANISSLAIATTIIKENMTGKVRRFLVFRDFKASIDFLADRIQSRQLYVGGTPPNIYKNRISDRNDWVVAYYREWVTGSSSANIPEEEKAYLLKMYAQGIVMFNE